MSVGTKLFTFWHWITDYKWKSLLSFRGLCGHFVHLLALIASGSHYLISMDYVALHSLVIWIVKSIASFLSMDVIFVCENFVQLLALTVKIVALFPWTRVWLFVHLSALIVKLVSSFPWTVWCFVYLVALIVKYSCPDCVAFCPLVCVALENRCRLRQYMLGFVHDVRCHAHASSFGNCCKKKFNFLLQFTFSSLVTEDSFRIDSSCWVPGSSCWS